MPVATDAQVQKYADERVRVRAEQVRALVNSLRDDKLALDDVYAACTQQSPTWKDARTDGPPRLLTPQDILTYNAFMSILLNVIDGTATTADVQNLHANWTPFQTACVRPVGS